MKAFLKAAVSASALWLTLWLCPALASDRPDYLAKSPETNQFFFVAGGSESGLLKPRAEEIRADERLVIAVMTVLTNDFHIIELPLSNHSMVRFVACPNPASSENKQWGRISIVEISLLRFATKRWRSGNSATAPRNLRRSAASRNNAPPRRPRFITLVPP
jgi:hypothetical protein